MDISTKPLTMLLNLILKTNTFPKVLKLAKAMPVFLSGIESKCINCRLVGVLSTKTKTFEVKIHKSLFKHYKK